jgi:subtilisin family serine protease
MVAAQAWIVPVVGCDIAGAPLAFSNLGRSIGRRGLQAPAVGVRGLEPDGTCVSMGGTSVAVPFVTGTIALLWSLFPDATPTEVRLAVADPRRPLRLVPPVLDASSAYLALRSLLERRSHGRSV